MLSLIETIILFIYTQNLIGNITLSSVIIPVSALNWGTKHRKRYKSV